MYKPEHVEKSLKVDKTLLNLLNGLSYLKGGFSLKEYIDRSYSTTDICSKYISSPPGQLSIKSAAF